MQGVSNEVQEAAMPGISDQWLLETPAMRRWFYDAKNKKM